MFCAQQCCGPDPKGETIVVQQESNAFLPGNDEDRAVFSEVRHDDPKNAQNFVEEKTTIAPPQDLPAAAEAVEPAPMIPIAPPVADAPAKASKTSQSGAKTEFKEFMIQVMKGDVGIGLDISAHDQVTLLIGKVKDGPIATWNASASQFERVRRGDRIIEANGVSDSAEEMIKSLRNQSALTLKIRRVTAFGISYSKEQDTDSLGLEFEDDPQNLIIKAIHPDGMAQALKKKVKADMELKPSDQIAEVNGVTGDSETLKKALIAGSKLDLLIKRSKY